VDRYRQQVSKTMTTVTNISETQANLADVRKRVTRKLQRIDRSPVMMLGDAPHHLTQVIGAAAHNAGRELVEPGAHDAHDGHTPLVALVPYEPGRMAERAFAVRTREGMADVMLVAVAPELSDTVFEESLSSGIDDCCLSTERALTRTLRGLEHLDEAPRSSHKDLVALVADESATARIAIAGAFRRAGFVVRFAADAADLTREAAEPNLAVAVVSATIADSVSAITPFRRYASGLSPDAAWIVNTPPRQVAAMRERVAGSDGVAIEVHDAFAIPETLLFVANAMKSQHGVDQRRAPRVLYGTAVYFRAAGQAHAHVGFSYNVSSGGLYVRSLCPPEMGDQLWIELVPPRSPRLVHLEAKVAWRRASGPNDTAVVPPGFGLQITGGAVADLELFERGYQAYLADRGC
jgi:hypothetical protein